MANRRIEVDVVANDQASSVFRSIRSNASSMTSGIMNALNSSVSAVGNLDNALRNYNNSMWRFNRVVSNAVGAAGNSIYNFTKDAINNFSELERQHAKTMGAMATNYGKTLTEQQKFLQDSEKLKQQALTLGTTGPNGKGSLNTVTDVSYAQTALIKSGMSAENILNSNALESILKFAGGNDLSIDDATTFAVNLGTVFNKPVKEWGNMLDMVTKAADISVIDVPDIMDSLTYTGGIASGLGRDLEEVLGVISVMGQAGLRGRVAGTGMQAFFTRILSAGELGDTAIGNAPTEYVGQMYNAFISDAVNADGSFKNMDEVSELLDTAMSVLNDQEQAWFAKKLFGLNQMKAAYALTGAVDEDGNLITDFIDQIENESEGINDIKYELMQGSQYGKLESLRNAWEGIETDFGDRLSPVVSTIADELFAFLNDPNGYEFNWDALRSAISESGTLIGEKYGEQLGEAIENIGDFGIDSAMIIDALFPQAGGIVSAIGKLAQGDISGALEEFAQGIKDTNTNIDGLPEDLQDAATAASNVVTAFTVLAGMNLGTQILQIITSAFNMFVGKPISWVTGKVTSASTTVSSANSSINATYAGVNTSTASISIGQIPLMNVNASVVNVFGGGGGSNPFGNGGGGLPTGGSPLLPSGGGFLPSLIGGAGGAALIGGTSKLPGLLGSGTTQKLLGSGINSAGNGAFNWMGANSAVLNADGSVAARLWNIGGKQMTASQIMGSTARMLGLAGTIGMVASVPSSGISWDKVYGNTLSKGIDAGYDNGDLRQYLYDNWQSSKVGAEYGAEYGTKNWAVQTYDAQTEMYASWMTTEGATAALLSIKNELQEQGTLSEEYLSQLVSYEGSTGGKYQGGQKDLEHLFSILFTDKYEKPWMYSGSFADQYTTRFAQGAINNNQTYDLSGLTDSMSAIADNAADTVGSVNRAINRIQQPIINVNITNKLDEEGNIHSEVDFGPSSSGADLTSFSNALNRRASQYGQTNMLN